MDMENTTEELPVGNQAAPEVDAPEVGTQETAPAPEPTEEFVVDGKTFASEKDAFEYMRSRYSETQTELKMAAARLEGMQDALSQGQAPPPPTPQQQAQDDWNEEEYWADPQGYLKKRLEKEKASLRAELQQTLQQQQNDQQIWNEFSTRHPELSNFKNEVETISNEFAKEVSMLARRNRADAYDFVAGKLKERFKQYASAVIPTRDLPNNGAGPSMGNTNVTKPVESNQPKKPMDFVSQMRSIRRR